MTVEPRGEQSRIRRARLGLRARATIGFALVALVVAVVLAGLTYGVAQRYLIEQREAVAARQAYVNARLARSVLRNPEPDVRGFLAGLGGGTAASPVLSHRNQWFSTSVAVGREALPSDLVRVVRDGKAGHQRYRDDNGTLQLAVGVALPAVDAAYFEIFSLAELERTLSVLRQALTVGATGASVSAGVIGYAVARRVVRPLRPVAEAAERISAGDLGTRLDANADPDLRRLFEAFNTMASSLDARIQREVRFAADVSHEVRAPLAALASAVQVIERRRAQLPEEVLSTFEALAAKVEQFQQMVLDLLEISRIDSGTAAVNLDLITLRPFLAQLLEIHGVEPQITFADDAPTETVGDRRRLGQALGNIIDNAARYAGGLKTITVQAGPAGGVRIGFEDRGPGIAAEEREAIFARFARGEAGHQAGSTSGTGLGLALVVEHLRLHNGEVWIEDAPGGGSRFVVELPAATS